MSSGVDLPTVLGCTIDYEIRRVNIGKQWGILFNAIVAVAISQLNDRVPEPLKKRGVSRRQETIVSVLNSRLLM